MIYDRSATVISNTHLGSRKSYNLFSVPKEKKKNKTVQKKDSNLNRMTIFRVAKSQSADEYSKRFFCENNYKSALNSICKN